MHLKHTIAGSVRRVALLGGLFCAAGLHVPAIGNAVLASGVILAAVAYIAMPAPTRARGGGAGGARPNLRREIGKALVATHSPDELARFIACGPNGTAAKDAVRGGSTPETLADDYVAYMMRTGYVEELLDSLELERPKFDVARLRELLDQKTDD